MTAPATHCASVAQALRKAGGSRRAGTARRAARPGTDHRPSPEPRRERSPRPNAPSGASLADASHEQPRHAAPRLVRTLPVLSHSALTPFTLGLHRLQKRLCDAGRPSLGDWAPFIGVVLILGLGTSWYMIDVGSPLTTVTAGPWVSWTRPGAPMPIPTRAPISPASARCRSPPRSSLTFVAFADSEGDALHSSCDYVVEGTRARHSLVEPHRVRRPRADLIANTAQRYTFTSESIALRPDGTLRSSRWRATRSPGNWLPTGGAGRLALMFTTFDAATTMLGRRRTMPSSCR